MTTPGFLRTVTAAISGQMAEVCPEATSPGLLVALSGGPDSVALLLAARHWSEASGGALAAAHLHHGLRGADADGDAAFCAELCAGLGIPLHAARQDPRPVARDRGGGLEEAGRHLRRRFLEEVLDREPGLHAAATGHHRDDQVETVLMRLLRGTGPEGLRGIRPVAGRFIHPLLGVNRAEILAHLQAAGQPWREDATNLAGDNLRARMRRELLPLVRGIFGPAADEAPARLAELLADDLDLLDGLTAAAAAEVIADGQLRVAELTRQEPALARRILRIWLRGETGGLPADLGRQHLESILAWLAEGASGSGLDLPGGLRLEREFDRVLCRGRDPLGQRQASDYRILVASGGGADAPGHGDPDDEDSWRLSCPAAALRGNLRLRNWREGDRMAPLGLDGTKKLSDLFRERRLPAGARAGVLVVEDDAGIIWAVGLARAERTRLLPDGGPIVTMTVARR